MILKDREYTPDRITSKKLVYYKDEVIGGGTFGKVYYSKMSDGEYAIKEYTYAKEPVHTTTIREIKALRAINSPFVLRIEEIVAEHYKLYLVFKYYPYDLTKLIQKESMSVNDIRHIFWQLAMGVRDIHIAGFLHRDLKPANVLIEYTNNGKYSSSEELTGEECGSVKRLKISFKGCKSKYKIKICDFGMAKPVSREMTPGVVTLWYRAPELLLGCTSYGESVDLWSLGCILVEMLTLRPIFKGSNEVEQLDIISGICGTINKESMPNVESYGYFSKYNLKESERTIKDKLRNIPEDALDLIDNLLILSPEKRMTIEECLKHRFFKN